MKDWENETVTQEEPPLYQQGRFPSVVDTDDLVFELGKQVVDRINKEKLLNGLLKKTRALEENFLASESTKVSLSDKAESFKASNELYVQNNEKLSAEVTRLRGENETLQLELNSKVVELTNLRKAADAQLTETTKSSRGGRGVSKGDKRNE